MTGQSIIEEIWADLLRYVLIVDGVFEITGGLILIAGAGPLASLFGIPEPRLLGGLGLVLILTGLALIRAAASESSARTLAWIAAILNAGWAIGSAAGLIFGWFPLTTAGKWAVGLTAEVVAFYAAVIRGVSARAAVRKSHRRGRGFLCRSPVLHAVAAVAERICGGAASRVGGWDSRSRLTDLPQLCPAEQ